MIAVAILVVIAILVLASVVRLVWRVSRGDLEIEPSSFGRQFFGRRNKDRP